MYLNIQEEKSLIRCHNCYSTIGNKWNFKSRNNWQRTRCCIMRFKQKNKGKDLKNKIVKGHIVVADKVLLVAETDLYMELRDKLGYSQNYPELYVRMNDNTIWLKNTPLGLMEDKIEAEKLMSDLKIQLPAYDWSIDEMEFEDAENIEWHRV